MVVVCEDAEVAPRPVRLRELIALRLELSALIRTQPQSHLSFVVL